MKKSILYVLAIVIIFSLGYGLNQLFTGGYPDIKLKTSAYSYLIAQSLGASEGINKLPIEGVNYTLGKIKYFNNNTWLVIPIVPLNSTANSAIIVLNRQGNGYSVILGPGSGFSTYSLSKLPNNVSTYIETGN